MEIVKNNKELLENTNNSLKDTKIYNEKIEINSFCKLFRFAT